MKFFLLAILLPLVHGYTYHTFFKVQRMGALAVLGGVTPNCAATPAWETWLMPLHQGRYVIANGVFTPTSGEEHRYNVSGDEINGCVSYKATGASGQHDGSMYIYDQSPVGATRNYAHVWFGHTGKGKLECHIGTAETGTGDALYIGTSGAHVHGGLDLGTLGATLGTNKQQFPCIILRYLTGNAAAGGANVATNTQVSAYENYKNYPVSIAGTYSEATCKTVTTGANAFMTINTVIPLIAVAEGIVGPTDANKDGTRRPAAIAVGECLLGWKNNVGSNATGMKLTCSGTSLVMGSKTGSTPCPTLGDVTTWPYNSTTKQMDNCKIGASSQYWKVAIQGPPGVWPCEGVSLQAPTVCPSAAAPAHTAYLSAATAAMLAFMTMFM